MRRLAFLVWLVPVASLAPVRAAEPGAGFLAVVPDARTFALGSAGVALPDLNANAFYDPASIVPGPRAAVTWTHLNMEPYLYPGITYDHASITYQEGERLGYAFNIAYLQYGETDVINEHTDYVGKFRSYDVAPSLSAAYRVVPSLSAGITLKGIYSLRVPNWVWEYMPYLGTRGGHAFSVAGDAGVQYRPLEALTLGLAVANLGPNLRYDSADDEFLPRAARLGFALKPTIPGPVSALLAGEAWRDLYPEVARSAWHAGAGLELGFSQFAFVRLGYLYQDRVDRGFTWGVGLTHYGVSLDVGVDSDVGLDRNVRFELSGHL